MIIAVLTLSLALTLGAVLGYRYAGRVERDLRAMAEGDQPG